MRATSKTTEFLVDKSPGTSTYAQVYGRPIAKKDLDDAGERLCALRQPISSLWLLVRMRPSLIKTLAELPPGHFDTLESVRRSFWYDGDEHPGGCLSQIRSTWSHIVGHTSQWRELVYFQSIHCCVIHGPTDSLLEFLSSEDNRSDQSPISAVVTPIQVGIPERSWHLSKGLETGFDEAGKLIDNLRFIKGSPLPDRISDDEFAVAAGWLRDFYSMLRPGKRLRSSAINILRRCVPSQRYLDGLGIGSVTAFGDSAGKGQKICMLDSGVDEGHPMLREQVVSYDRFDANGQFKEAYAAMDSGCHGTKIASILCGNEISLADAGLSGKGLDIHLSDYGLTPDSRIRAGLASGAKLFVGSVIGGDPMNEHGQISTIAAGFEWAADNHLNGFCCLNVSIEPIASAYTKPMRDAIEAVCDLMQSDYGIPVVVAAGNKGRDSCSFASNAGSASGIS